MNRLASGKGPTNKVMTTKTSLAIPNACVCCLDSPSTTISAKAERYDGINWGQSLLQGGVVYGTTTVTFELPCCKRCKIHIWVNIIGLVVGFIAAFALAIWLMSKTKKPTGGAIFIRAVFAPALVFGAAAALSRFGIGRRGERCTAVVEPVKVKLKESQFTFKFSNGEFGGAFRDMNPDF